MGMGPTTPSDIAISRFRHQIRCVCVIVSCRVLGACPCACSFRCPMYKARPPAPSRALPQLHSPTQCQQHSRTPPLSPKFLLPWTTVNSNKVHAHSRSWLASPAACLRSRFLPGFCRRRRSRQLLVLRWGVPRGVVGFSVRWEGAADVVGLGGGI
jgi:hypothetical protein